MDNGDRVEAANGASRREGVSGAPQAPRSGVLSGREVRVTPVAGPSPSRTEPQATLASAGGGASKRVSVIRVAGRAGSTYRPYPAGEPGRRPGASLLPEGESSVPPMPQRGRPEALHRFRWSVYYQKIMERNVMDAQEGDFYAAAASASRPS